MEKYFKKNLFTSHTYKAPWTQVAGYKYQQMPLLSKHVKKNLLRQGVQPGRVTRLTKPLGQEFAQEDTVVTYVPPGSDKLFIQSVPDIVVRCQNFNGFQSCDPIPVKPLREYLDPRSQVPIFEQATNVIGPEQLSCGNPATLECDLARDKTRFPVYRSKYNTMYQGQESEQDYSTVGVRRFNQEETLKNGYVKNDANAHMSDCTVAIKRGEQVVFYLLVNSSYEDTIIFMNELRATKVWKVMRASGFIKELFIHESPTEYYSFLTAAGGSMPHFRVALACHHGDKATIITLEFDEIVAFLQRASKEIGMEIKKLEKKQEKTIVDDIVDDNVMLTSSQTLTGGTYQMC